LTKNKISAKLNFIKFQNNQTMKIKKNKTEGNLNIFFKPANNKCKSAEIIKDKLNVREIRPGVCK